MQSELGFLLASRRSLHSLSSGTDSMGSQLSWGAKPLHRDSWPAEVTLMV